MPRPKKSKAEVQKAFRLRQGDSLREKERERGRKRRRQAASEEKKAKIRDQAKLRQETFRARKRAERAAAAKPAETAAGTAAAAATPGETSPFASKQSISRALNRVRSALPTTPARRVAILQRLHLENNVPLPEPIKRCRMPDDVIKEVIDFFLREDISMWSPGRKEFLNINGEAIQKRYLSMSLKEAHHLFVQESGQRVSLSKFCELRPQHVVPFGDTPIYSCCCIQHENFKSVCNALAGKVPGLPPYTSDWMRQMVYCDTPQAECALGTCAFCSSLESHRVPGVCPDGNDMGIAFRIWQRNKDTQRMDQVVSAVSVTAAHQQLMEMLPSFVVHERTRVQQSSVYRSQKANLAEDEVVIHFDFSENYSCSHQDAIQSAYWSQNQVTLFTVAVYRHSGSSMLTLVSDTTDHTKTTIAVFLHRLLEKFTTPGRRVHFWSDGPSSQFKNRFMVRFAEIACSEFQLASLSWNFFATSHGKGAIDGLGATLKRIASRLVRTRSAIIADAADFVQAVQASCTIDCELITKAQIAQEYEANFLALFAAPEVAGIKSLHFWSVQQAVPGVQSAKLSGLPPTVSTVQQSDQTSGAAMCTSSSAAEPGTSNQPEPQPGSIAAELAVGCWVLVDYDGSSFPGQIVKIKQQGPEKEYKVNVMVRSGNTRSYSWPKSPDCIYYPLVDIQKLLDPPVPVDTRGHFSFAL